MSLLRVQEEGPPHGIGAPRQGGSRGKGTTFEGRPQADGGAHRLQAPSGRGMHTRTIFEAVV